ncbi:MAG TPA: dihydroneopterin aldolase [Chthoniobacteraceae bacterium]|jgi:dihydroneopterin aldolase|nr:dihydroneopterin aldolase [Chthoniobacteraceae bacterium]
MDKDCILIQGLDLPSRIGVPEGERAAPQRLTVNLRLIPRRDFCALEDNLANTVNYAAVCDVLRAEAARKPRHLIETLAGDLAARLLADFPLRAVEIELRKYILPDTEYVGVKIWRTDEAHPQSAQS